MTSKIANLIAIVQLTLSASAYAEEAQKYIGMVNPAIPKDCKVTGDGIVTGEGTATIGFKRLWCETASVFWLQQRVHETQQQWRVIDVLSIPRHEKYGVLMGGEDECTYATEPNSWVIAYGDYGHIISAWAMPINPNEKKFRSIPADKVTCVFVDHSN